MFDDMRQYLSALNIDSEQKRYAMNFCKKAYYLNELHEIAIRDTDEHVNIGYGNVNSQICFVFRDKDRFDLVKSLVQDILDKFNINIWNVYITFVDKTASEYNKKYSYLANEINAVGSKLLYVLDKGDTLYKDVIDSFTTHNIALPERHFAVDIEKIASSDTEARKELWSIFRYIINYKEIEQEE